ncbi:hypothetical protein CVIRNUC_003780 [Coccomyxa viridis]|uniref:Alanyl-transfer RNA synthetases family profile domain-containing protein n=1 Tax=Coccomyxa viridis TaxID=1274662 RepID=A0AAV1I3C4_9CHLO|nr:hypothetical protein CVIRNUC_003780 [Coccomyxa viridis]
MTSFELLPCQQDCYTREGHARVLSCDAEPVTHNCEQRFKVVLSQSPLYPEGGGQPADRGRLSCPDGKLLAEVVDVRREADGAVAAYTNAAVPSGAEVQVSIDWANRFDLMQQHTGQHLLSAACDEVAGADTVSWELHPRPAGDEGSDSVCVDLAVPHLSSEQLRAIEERCNEVIRKGAAVSHVILTDSNRQQVASSSVLRGELPPADKVKGPVRMIEIEGVDINACGGTHVHSAAEIQAIKIKSLERTKGMVRLRFIAGGRVFAAMGRFLAQEGDLNKALGCGLPGWRRAVQKLQADRKQLKQRLAAYSTEIAQTYALSLLPQLLLSNGWLHAHREDADAEFLNTVAAVVESASPGSLTFLTGSCTMPGSRQAKLPDKLDKVFLLSGPQDKVAELGPKVAAALGTRGGIRPGAFQGKVGSFDRLPQALKVLHDSLAQSRRSLDHVPRSGGLVGTQPMIGSQELFGAQPMPMLLPASLPVPTTLPPILPPVPGCAAEAQLLANVELAEQHLREFNIMFEEQRNKLLFEEDTALADYQRNIGSLPTRPVGPVNGRA